MKYNYDENALAPIREMLLEGHEIKVTWNCGGDETIISFSVDGKDLEYQYAEPPHFTALRELLIRQFGLPNAGEFYNEGGGDLFVDTESNVGIKSKVFAYFDQDEFSLSEETEAIEIKTPIRVTDQIVMQKIEAVGGIANTTFYGGLVKKWSLEHNIDYIESEAKKQEMRELITDPELLGCVAEKLLVFVPKALENWEVYYEGKITAEGLDILSAELTPYRVIVNVQGDRTLLF